MWLTNLKIAIVEKNPEAIKDLLDDIPTLSNAEDIETAIYLLREATELIYTLQGDTKVSMDKIKKNISFLRSTDVPSSKKLDIKL